MVENLGYFMDHYECHPLMSMVLCTFHEKSNNISEILDNSCKVYFKTQHEFSKTQVSGNACCENCRQSVQKNKPGLELANTDIKISGFLTAARLFLNYFAAFFSFSSSISSRFTFC